MFIGMNSKDKNRHFYINFFIDNQPLLIKKTNTFCYNF
jgi:hypothetical protein